MVWSHGRALASLSQTREEWEWGEEEEEEEESLPLPPLPEGTTRVTSMLVRPSAKSSRFTFRRFPVTWRLMRVLSGLF